MLQDHFLSVVQELSEGLSQQDHPFKYPTLSTIYNNQPRCRTVVLRALDDQLTGTVFTDARSNKLEGGFERTAACLLFYHPEKLLQVRLDGYLQVLQDPIEVKRLFSQVSSKALKDYTTTGAPGTPIDHPDHIAYKPRAQHHFMVLKFITQQLEFLQLKRPNHLRAIYNKNDDWQGQWLVP